MERAAGRVPVIYGGRVVRPEVTGKEALIVAQSAVNHAAIVRIRRMGRIWP